MRVLALTAFLSVGCGAVSTDRRSGQAEKDGRPEPSDQSAPSLFVAKSEPKLREILWASQVGAKSDRWSQCGTWCAVIRSENACAAHKNQVACAAERTGCKWDDGEGQCVDVTRCSVQSWHTLKACPEQADRDTSSCKYGIGKDCPTYVWQTADFSPALRTENPGFNFKDNEVVGGNRVFTQEAFSRSFGKKQQRCLRRETGFVVFNSENAGMVRMPNGRLNSLHAWKDVVLSFDARRELMKIGDDDCDGKTNAFFKPQILVDYLVGDKRIGQNAVTILLSSARFQSNWSGPEPEITSALKGCVNPLGQNDLLPACNVYLNAKAFGAKMPKNVVGTNWTHYEVNFAALFERYLKAGYLKPGAWMVEEFNRRNPQDRVPADAKWTSQIRSINFMTAVTNADLKYSVKDVRLEVGD